MVTWARGSWSVWSLRGGDQSISEQNHSRTWLSLECMYECVYVGPWSSDTSPPPAGLWLSEMDPAGLLLVWDVSALLDQKQSANSLELEVLPSLVLAVT